MSQNQEEFFLDISPLISGEAEKLGFDRTFSSDYEENGIKVDSFSVSGEVRGTEECLFVTGEITFTAKSPCARCLKDVEKEFECGFDVPVAFEESGDISEDYILSEDDKIDIFSLGYEKLILNLPFRLLCSDDCKGICSKCGKDLNLGECSCSDREVDPRLAGLSDFFK